MEQSKIIDTLETYHLATQEARHHAVLAEMEMVLREPPEPVPLADTSSTYL